MSETVLLRFVCFKRERHVVRPYETYAFENVRSPKRNDLPSRTGETRLKLERNVGKTYETGVRARARGLLLTSSRGRRRQVRLLLRTFLHDFGLLFGFLGPGQSYGHGQHDEHLTENNVVTGARENRRAVVGPLGTTEHDPDAVLLTLTSAFIAAVVTVSRVFRDGYWATT